MNIGAALAGISAIHKLLPVVEAIGKEVGPVVEQEIADGKVIWGDVVKCFDDLKGAVEVAKSAAEGAAPQA